MTMALHDRFPCLPLAPHAARRSAKLRLAGREGFDVSLRLRVVCRAYAWLFAAFGGYIQSKTRITGVPARVASLSFEVSWRAAQCSATAWCVT